jgi:hypothetical protein
MLTIFVLILLLILLFNPVYLKDLEYLTKVPFDNISPLLNNNLLKNPNKIKNKILIITFDDRNKEPFVIEHNKNVKQYVNKWGYEYKFFDTCNHPVYWCKIYMLLDELNTNKYDYVMWLDSDTVIKRSDIFLDDILNKYNSDIFIGDDNAHYWYVLNSGVFIIKNSTIGRQFLQDCINNFDKKNCLKDGKLLGMWGGSCYEQGIMNLLILEKYYKYTTLLPKNIIYNSEKCSNNVFVMHNYGQTSSSRFNCFKNP